MTGPAPLDKLTVADRRSGEFPAEETFRDGVVIPVNKPLNWTSFDVVKYIRNRVPVRKVGHAGTLDPLAEGLLVLCCGRATKSVSLIQDTPKTYLAEITLGSSTPSFDAATEADASAEWRHVTRRMVEDAVQRSFTGEILQVPPVYSALKKNGRRLYSLARQGADVKPDPRKVVLYEAEVTDWNPPVLCLQVRCGKGFYIRSLAHDLGQAVGTLGHLTALKRTEIGPFSLEHAWNPDEFGSWSANG